jgi:uncharacterized repeat protein (TIGR01451 family)
VTRPRLGVRVSHRGGTSEGDAAPAGGGRGAACAERTPWARLLSCLLVLPVVLGAMATSGCGGGVASLSVTLGLADGSPAVAVAPGQPVDFVITVTDIGTAATAGLTVTANLPANFRYTDTNQLVGSAVRTAPVDAQVNSQQPTWGVWELSGYKDYVSIPFQALAGGSPGTYTMTASASASTAATTQSAALLLKLTPAPLLSATVSVSPSQAVPGEDVIYQVTVYNKGTGPADAVSVLVTLPPVFIYDGARVITGDSGRVGGTDPVEGSALPYFDGFSVPAPSGTAPGTLTIKFDAQVLSSAGAQGTYPVGVQVLGDQGLERVDIAEAAPVMVT